jgi:hypothetical protein
MSTLLLKKVKTEGQRIFFKTIIPLKALLSTTTGSTLIDKIAFALTNRRAIDKNYKIVWKGDEREEL